MSDVGEHGAGGVCLNPKNSTSEVSKYCNILLLTLPSIHSRKWQTCNLWGLLCTGVSAMTSQIWGVLVCDYWWFVWPKWLVGCTRCAGLRLKTTSSVLPLVSLHTSRKHCQSVLQLRPAHPDWVSTEYWYHIILKMCFDTFSVASFLDSGVCWDR